MSFYTFLPKLLNMSLTGAVAIICVLLLRLMLKKAPKVISYALWAVVLFRLLCPVSVTSGLSLFGLLDAPSTSIVTGTNSMEYIPENIVQMELSDVATPAPGVSNTMNDTLPPGVSSTLNGTLPQGQAQLATDSLKAPVAIGSHVSIGSYVTIGTYVWLLGVMAMAAYSISSYIRLRKKLLMVSPLQDNIRLADEITTPFVMGLIRPKIYLPSDTEEHQMPYLILHEKHHIRRGDHIFKALAFLALSIHWFNPLVWIAFIYASRDMEMSCDEAVVKKLGEQILSDYAASLLSLATGKTIIAGVPLAFGEGDTKGRICNLAHWKKPAFWVVIAAVAACVILGVGLLTNPVKEGTSEFSEDRYCHSEKAGAWYTDEEVISMVKDLYGTQTSFLQKDGSVYHFRAQVSQPQEGTFDFAVEQDKDLLVDNYRNVYFKYISDIYFEKYHMPVEWQEFQTGARMQYSPTFMLSSDNDREIMSFCEKFCDYVEYCIAVEPFGEETQYFQMFSMTVARINFAFRPTFTVEEYERTKMYNELYVRIDEVLHAPKEEPGDGNIVTSEEMEITQELVDYYMTIEPSCSFLTDKGMGYRMIPVDRALGSSFYVLIGTEDGGKTCTFINPDPYNGSGGESRWIAFLDEDRGFSCLAHAAGAYGSLYRTEDGGVSWEKVDYPSAKAKLPDGSYYNPFVMPEKVYEENGMLFLEAGQGADGDYYDEELGYCHGLYQSEDGGRNWSFVRNIAMDSDKRYQ